MRWHREGLRDFLKEMLELREMQQTHHTHTKSTFSVGRCMFSHSNLYKSSNIYKHWSAVVDTFLKLFTDTGKKKIKTVLRHMLLCKACINLPILSPLFDQYMQYKYTRTVSKEYVLLTFLEHVWDEPWWTLLCWLFHRMPVGFKKSESSLCMLRTAQLTEHKHNSTIYPPLKIILYFLTVFVKHSETCSYVMH